jgi:hypothetical protein
MNWCTKHRCKRSLCSCGNFYPSLEHRPLRSQQVSVNDLRPGDRIVLASRRGTYVALARVTAPVKDDPFNNIHTLVDVKYSDGHEGHRFNLYSCDDDTIRFWRIAL